MGKTIQKRASLYIEALKLFIINQKWIEMNKKWIRKNQNEQNEPKVHKNTWKNVHRTIQYHDIMFSGRAAIARKGRYSEKGRAAIPKNFPRTLLNSNFKMLIISFIFEYF